MIACIVKVLYSALALVASCWYGRNAVRIFSPITPPVIDKREDLQAYKKWRAWKIHQCWLNFAGSATGWLCLWFVGVRVWFDLTESVYPAFGWGYAALAVTAFLGITGHLPYILMKTADVIGQSARAAGVIE